jgi:signal transduction histidine kinase
MEPPARDAEEPLSAGQRTDAVQTLRRDADFALLRHPPRDGRRGFLMLSTTSDPPGYRNVQRLEHEYALRDLLDFAGAVRPLALLEEHGHLALMLDDPGGHLLSQLTGEPWEMAAFLRVAIGLTVTLGRLHERGLIHKDIKPTNLLTNVATGDTWLTGCGVALRVPREGRAADPPQVIEGTLAYIAPEQTGRMGRSVDSRSDLYSLGITLFEMLTGELPFAASDPIEWIHCHMERQAPRAHERRKSVPEQIGVLVDKLLAKPAESRYQTAGGLEADLRRCLLMLEATGQIDAFPLGATDVPDRKLVPDKPRFRGEPVQTAPTTTPGAPVDHLDVTTAIRVLQALASEIVLERWIDKLMTIALEDAGAQRGVLLVLCAEELTSLAEATMTAGGAEVRIPKGGEALPALPSSVVRYVVRTKETVLLDDAAGSIPFSTDAYIASGRSQSILCLPLVKGGELAGVLYLENPLPSVFTPRRAAVLKLVASQAATSLENARLYAELQRENDVRKRTEDALRRSKTYLAEAEHVSRSGAFGWNLSTGALVVSDETYRLAGIERSSTPITADDVWRRIHPQDAPRVREQAERAIREGGNLDFEHRFVMPDGSVKFVHVLGRPVKDESGAVEYVGAAMDITQARGAEAALHEAQAELAHVTRVTALGELAASIAHEVNQPLAAISANATASLNWLAFAPPKIESAREALEAIVTDSERAGDVLSRIRRLLSRSPSERAACEVNVLVSGVLPLVRSQFERQRVALEARLGEGGPTVLGDAVQLQQVLLNLLLNAAEACKDLGPERRRVMVRTAAERRNGEGRAVVAVADSGHGFDPTAAARIFEPFYTTKPGGLGMGLSISRSIVARHEGQLTATANADYGVTFSLSLPLRP